MKNIQVLILIVFIGFNLCDAQINYVNRTVELNLNTHTGQTTYGNGVSVQDFNNDGLDDITLGTSQGLPMYFYKNLGTSFELQTLNIPVNISQVKQVNWVDIDNDGDKDLFLASNNSGNRLYLNDGNLNFTDITDASGLRSTNIFTSGASWGDFNNDGFLDVFLTNKDDNLNIGNSLYKNQGDLTFREVTESSGISQTPVPSFCSAFFDYNNDGFQDIYISNDRSNYPNVLYKNNGNETFTDVSVASNTNLAIDAMSVTIGDYNNDGYFDIYVTNTPAGNVFLKNNGDETFTNVTTETATAFNSVGWSAVFMDAENDKDLDLYVSGMFSGANPNLISAAFYVNQNDGSYTLPGNCGFLNDTSRSFSNAIGDFNNDGLSDIVVNNSNSETLFLWENESVTTNNYLKVKLVGTQSNKDGIGSVIEISINGDKQYRYTLNGEGYLGQNSAYKLFGLGNANTIDYIKVTWLSGVVDVFNNVAANQTITVIENSNSLNTDSFKAKTPLIYPNPASTIIQFQHLPKAAFISVYTILGEKLFTTKSEQLLSNSSLNIKALKTGVYLVTIEDLKSSKTTTLKFIKN